ncbi:MAG: metalloregulator ArsR/SmtB family transcription factor [Thermodesulfobacteriota bacterium]|nr:metalloregulator ArsR/SmtB family transcription factor [Thermodesulfobacteriota bacterium]
MGDFFKNCGCTAGRMEIPDTLSDEQARQQLADLSRGLAHPARIKIVRMLANMPPNRQCICGDIVSALPLAQSSVSQHLKTLKETGWIQGEIERPRVCYCINHGVLEYYIALLQKVLCNTGKGGNQDD